jgi:hypothetical protein
MRVNVQVDDAMRLPAVPSKLEQLAAAGNDGGDVLAPIWMRHIADGLCNCVKH